MRKEFSEHRLIKSIENGDLETVKEILSSEEMGIDYRFQSRPHRGSTPLIVAVYYEQPDIVEELLSRDPNVKVRNSSGLTAQYWANVNANAEILDMLKAAEAFDNLPTSVKKTANSWVKLGENEVAYITLHKKSSRKISRIFNFYARDMVIHSENIKTPAEAVSHPVSFDTLDPVILVEAAKAFEQAGGKLDKDKLFKPRIIIKHNRPK